jgi:hypothetical protein
VDLAVVDLAALEPRDAALGIPQIPEGNKANPATCGNAENV